MPTVIIVLVRFSESLSILDMLDILIAYSIGSYLVFFTFSIPMYIMVNQSLSINCWNSTLIGLLSILFLFFYISNLIPPVAFGIGMLLTGSFYATFPCGIVGGLFVWALGKRTSDYSANYDNHSHTSKTSKQMNGYMEWDERKSPRKLAFFAPLYPAILFSGWFTFFAGDIDELFYVLFVSIACAYIVFILFFAPLMFIVYKQITINLWISIFMGILSPVLFNMVLGLTLFSIDTLDFHYSLPIYLSLITIPSGFLGGLAFWVLGMPDDIHMVKSLKSAH